MLVNAGLAGKNDRVKILGDGELKSALTVRAHKFSKSAEEKITKAGGKVEVIGGAEPEKPAAKAEKPAAKAERPAAKPKGTQKDQ